MSKRAARDRILRHTIHVVVAAVSMLVHAGDSVEHCGGLWSSTTNANVKLGGSDDESSGGGGCGAPGRLSKSHSQEQCHLQD